jgi:hypothetical protein
MRRFGATVLVLAISAVVGRAHDLEGTRVVLSFATDGSFVLDITHNPDWLLLRLESFAGGVVPARIAATDRDARLHELGPVVIDRVVVWVDGHEIRPDSAEYLAPQSTFRLRGRIPMDSASLRWLYGPVADPYPFIVQRADGRIQVEQIEGSNWSGTMDLSGQFNASRAATVNQLAVLVGLFALAVAWRLRSRGYSEATERLPRP